MARHCHAQYLIVTHPPVSKRIKWCPKADLHLHKQFSLQYNLILVKEAGNFSHYFSWWDYSISSLKNIENKNNKKAALAGKSICHFPVLLESLKSSAREEIFLVWFWWLNDGPRKELINLMSGNLVCNIEHDINSCASAKDVLFIYKLLCIFCYCW